MMRIHAQSSLRFISRHCSRTLPVALPRHLSTSTTAARTTIPMSLPLPLLPPTRRVPQHHHHLSSFLRRTFATKKGPPPESFTFYTSASFSPKGKKYDPEKEIFSHVSGSPESTPNPEKRRSRAGQDAYFVTGLEHAEGDGNDAVAVGVADGVGGYDKIGIDSAIFSQALVISIASAAQAATSAAVNPRDLLEIGYARTLEDDKIKGGAATACLGVFKKDGTLNVANLGDSGFVILRQGKVHYASQPQTHDFNFPLQLVYIPAHSPAEVTPSDTPEMSTTSSHQLQEGDVVLFATDGVWDNISAQEILRGVSAKMLETHCWKIPVEGEGIKTSAKHLTAATMTKEDHVPLHTALARTVIRMAKSASMNTKRDGPFAKEVQRLFPNENYHGGKVDDITVIVTVVKKNYPTPKLAANL